VVGTFGRGIYVLDDYTPLRQLKPEILAKESALFAVKDALMYAQSQPIGGRGKAWQGESFFTVDNPPFGATFTFYLKEAIRTKRQQRQAAERDAARRNVTPPYPTRAQLREEQEEEPPAILLTVADAARRVVRRITGPVRAGIHRVTWDLRYPAATLGAGGGPRFGDPEQPQELPSGHLVMPGKFTVSLAKRVDGVVTSLDGPVSFSVGVEGLEAMASADRTALAEFQEKLARLQRAVTGSLETATAVRTRLGLVRRAIDEGGDPDNKLRTQVRTLEKQLGDVIDALRGSRDDSETPPPSISARVNSLASRQRMAAVRPTATQLEQYGIAAEEFKPVHAKLRTLVDGDLARLEKALEAAGVAWTPGRLPEWNDR
jgi:hypothetical protein